MKKKFSLAAKLSVSKTIPRRCMRILQPTEFVTTETGTRAAAQLRPGDRIPAGPCGAFWVIQWIAAGRNGQGGLTLRVMLGNGAEDQDPSGMPVIGRVSRKTGRVEMDRNASERAGRRVPLH